MRKGQIRNDATSSSTPHVALVMEREGKAFFFGSAKLRFVRSLILSHSFVCVCCGGGAVEAEFFVLLFSATSGEVHAKGQLPCGLVAYVCRAATEPRKRRNLVGAFLFSLIRTWLLQSIENWEKVGVRGRRWMFGRALVRRGTKRESEELKRKEKKENVSECSIAK